MSGVVLCPCRVATLGIGQSIALMLGRRTTFLIQNSKSKAGMRGEKAAALGGGRERRRAAALAGEEGAEGAEALGRMEVRGRDQYLWQGGSPPLTVLL